MREFSIYTVVALNIFILVRYCWLLYKKEIKPALAMWLFFSIAVTMSLVTYMAEGNHGFLDNILNTADIVYVVTVTIAILIWGDKSSRFTKFDTGCLVAVILIVLFWIITQDHIITNFCIQGIMVISYFPVVKRLLESRENTEPFSVWFIMMLNPAISLLSSKGTLATVYSVRAIICVAVLMLLMLRVELLARKDAKHSSVQ
ncbi:MAG TPA: hypothetical protein PLH91_12980 [Tenuifilaceae bacterium]|nr:hypothetical protein [Tenuifilaceae bacterium]HOZ15172.1 hypothetical protein [Tenuifilaceae bacterium]HPI46142.1 hypothetical protein [Tenuifilaceae bacterium]HPN22363.1 hypothetical protein [Tenuifilaceae bacterium]